VELPSKARDAYNTLARDWLYYHEQGNVLADHTLKRLIRFQQLTSGYLRSEDGEDIPMHTAKIDAVISDLGEIIESGEKAVIFHRFTWEGDQYEQALRRCFPGVLVGRISGATSPDGRSRFVENFANEPGGAIGVLQTQAAGVGISFAEATHVFFVSQSFSHTDETQARDRVYKPGHNRCITYVRAADTVDEFIASVLDRKAGIHESVTHADVREMVYGNLRVH
jgi:SNF2 family DNA or RNA helicase